MTSVHGAGAAGALGEGGLTESGSMNSQVVVIGKQVGGREFELVGAGAPCYIVATTRVTAAVRRALNEGIGQKVLADISPGEREGVRCGIASFVRELESNPEDLRRLDAALVAFRRAGLSSFVSDPARQLKEAFVSLASHGFPSWDPAEYLVDLFLRDQICFPETWWHDDPESGVDEMDGLLKRLHVGGALRKSKLLADARKDLDRSEDEDAARDRLCEALCFAANVLVAKAGKSERFCGPYFSRWNDGEPNWIFSEPELFERLIECGVLVRWSGQRVKPSYEYKRPPDLGEMDLENFPSGDDPF